jgi:urease accessory protein
MLKVIDKSPAAMVEVYDTLTLPYATRQKGRFRAISDKGREVGVFLPRGGALRHGELLHTECGHILVVQAQAEAVIHATSDDWPTFARACYHLGNRHVPLQIGERWLRFQPDHVLRDMVELHGLQTSEACLSFTPEDGAYGGQRAFSLRAHAHNHSHGHTHDSSHDNSHDNNHTHSHDHAHSHD